MDEFACRVAAFRRVALNKPAPRRKTTAIDDVLVVEHCVVVSGRVGVFVLVGNNEDAGKIEVRRMS